MQWTIIFWILFGAVLTSVEAASYRVVCYYESWAVSRPGNGKFDIKDIDPGLCTHHIYSFVSVASDGKIKIDDSSYAIKKGGFKNFNAMRKKNKSIKTLVAIGGASAGSKTFSKVVNDGKLRSKFVNNIVSFLKKYGFNGIDIDWEFPTGKGGKASDKKTFVSFLKELRPKLSANKFLMTAAVSADVSTIDAAYDVPALAKYLDFINIMAYDLHGPWSSKTGINAPLYAGSSDRSDYERKLNVDYAIKYWIRKGAPASKLNLGMGTYGNSFTLKSASKNGIGDSISGPGKRGPYSGENGKLGYNEICEQVRAKKWKVHWNNQQKVPYAVNGDQWVGYDNVASIKLKAQYIRDHHLGGAMIWAIGMDDFHNKCGGGKYPLIKTINSVLKRK